MKPILNRDVAIGILLIAPFSALIGWILDVPPGQWLFLFVGVTTFTLIDIAVTARFGARIALISFTCITACLFLGVFISIANSANWFEWLIVAALSTVYCVARYIGGMPNSSSSGRDISADGADERRST